MSTGSVVGGGVVVVVVGGGAVVVVVVGGGAVVVVVVVVVAGGVVVFSGSPQLPRTNPNARIPTNAKTKNFFISPSLIRII